jgi:hypothetical protein
MNIDKGSVSPVFVVLRDRHGLANRLYDYVWLFLIDEVPALTLHYREAGEEDAPPLILLHGLGGAAQGCDRTAPALADSSSPNGGLTGLSGWLV